MKRELLIIGILSLMLSPVFAMDVILTTTLNYPDSAMASVVANKIGAEVLFTEKDNLPSDVYQEILNVSPEHIYIIGGPAVISERIEENLSETYNVTRLWGYTKFGTAVEVVNYFWPEGSDEIVLVQLSNDILDNESEILDYAKSLAILDEVPLVIVPYNTITPIAKQMFEDLGISSVKIVSNVKSSITKELNNLSITNISTLNTTQIKNRILERINKSNTTFMIATGNTWRDRLNAISSGIVIPAINETEVQEIISKIKNYTKVHIISRNRTFINKTLEHLRKNNITTNISGEEVRYAVKIMEKVKEKIREKAMNYTLNTTAIKNQFEKLNFSANEFMTRVNETLESMNITEISSEMEKYNELANEIQEDYNSGNYVSAYRKYKQLQSELQGVYYKYENKYHIKDYMIKLETIKNQYETQITSEVNNVTSMILSQVQSRVNVIKNRLNNTSIVNNITNEVSNLTNNTNITSSVASQIVSNVQNIVNGFDNH